MELIITVWLKIKVVYYQNKYLLIKKEPIFALDVLILFGLINV